MPCIISEVANFPKLMGTNRHRYNVHGTMEFLEKIPWLRTNGAALKMAVTSALKVLQGFVGDLVSEPLKIMPLLTLPCDFDPSI